MLMVLSIIEHVFMSSYSYFLLMFYHCINTTPALTHESEPVHINVHTHHEHLTPSIFSSFLSISSSNIYLDDLRHMTAVRSDLHNKFAEENEMASFLMSAKSGDQVKQAFFKVAATLAGKSTRS